MSRILNFSVNRGLIILIIYQPWLMAESMRGHNMHPANIPFVASLGTMRSKPIEHRAHFCSGSLIAENLVLTAAHCLINETPYRIDVVFGIMDLKDAEPGYGVHSWISFKKWATEKDPPMITHQLNDLAIVKLDRPVVGVTLASITTWRNTDLYGKNATLIGWTAGQSGKVRFMKKARVQVLTPMECDARFQLVTNKIVPTPNGVLCTASNPFTLSTCGDSGGPLLDENNDILGVNQGFAPTGSLNCTEEFADQHRFNFHLDFIDEYRQFVDEVKASSSFV